jgi:NAD(P)-dependent dehydrogenase (short-subunit alcohol dehydrogenase family)
MIGRKVADAVAASGRLGDRDVSRMTLADTVKPEIPNAFSGEGASLALDIADPRAAHQLVVGRPDVIIHLAAIVSGEAELDFDKGYRINLDGTRHLFDAIRHLSEMDGYCPRVVFSSSVAAFGAPVPDEIDDTFLTAPLTSYGTQKVIGELLLQDYTRRGFFDGHGDPACRRSASGPDCPTRPRRASSRASCASRWPASPPSCRCPTRCGTGMRARAPPWDSSPMPPRWTPGRSAIAGCSTCPEYRPRWPNRSRRCDRIAGRQGGGADPPRACARDHAHRLGLAARLCARQGAGSGVPRRIFLRRDHSHSHRGRDGGRDPGLTRFSAIRPGR